MDMGADKANDAVGFVLASKRVGLSGQVYTRGSISREKTCLLDGHQRKSYEEVWRCGCDRRAAWEKGADVGGVAWKLDPVNGITALKDINLIKRGRVSF